MLIEREVSTFTHTGAARTLRGRFANPLVVASRAHCSARARFVAWWHAPPRTRVCRFRSSTAEYAKWRARARGSEQASHQVPTRRRGVAPLSSRPSRVRRSRWAMGWGSIAKRAKAPAVIARHWLTLVRACALLAVAASTALLLHYLAPADSAFCSARSACEAVRKSTLGSFAGPYVVPLTGVVAYVVFFWLSFFPGQRRLLRGVGALGGLLGLGFVVYQALVVGAFCWMCVVVDGLALTIGVICVLPGSRKGVPLEPFKGWAWAGLFAIAINAPSVWTWLRPSAGVPDAIRALQQPGLNVIEFMDFQCPHCRRLHPMLKAELAAVPGPVHVQRFHVPLRFHPLAEDAARAAICATTFGKEAEMANRLFEQPLSNNVWFEHAEALGLDAGAFRACLKADTTTATLATHRKLYDQTEARGLPLTFIGDERLEGAPPPQVVHQTFVRALAPSTPQIPAWLFVTALVALATGLLVVGRKRPPSNTSQSAGQSIQSDG